MKKSCSLAVIVLLCVSTQVWGQDVNQKGGYLGIGASYALESFDLGLPGDRSYHSSLGLNVKVGYDVKEWLSLEFDFDYLSKFTFSRRHSDAVPRSDPPVVVSVVADNELTITTCMVVAKLFPLSDLKTMKPHLTAGAGIMRAEAVAKKSYHGHFSTKNSYSESGACAKLGFGMDFAANDHVTVGVEGSHMWGFDEVDYVRYFNLTLGAAYHF